jgi:branched-chain amino acid transport system substrate-binding protein
MKNKILWVVLVIVAVILILLAVFSGGSNKNEYNIGFVGPITGSSAKYGTFEAVSLAVDQINSSGGINGKKLHLIAEDGQCNSTVAAGAVSKLVNVDKVKIILGGHCTPESTIVAKAAGDNKIVALASITSSPMFSAINPYFARTTWLSTQQGTVVAKYLSDTAKTSKIAVVYEQTDYARPIAEKVKTEFEKANGKVVDYESVMPNTNDFRSVLAKIKTSGAQAVFVSTQSPDVTLNFLKQIKELGLSDIKVFGNDNLNVQINIDKNPTVFEGSMFASTDFDESSPLAKSFIEAYKLKYHVDNIPSGILTAESYDAVYIIADALKKYGMDVEKITSYIHGLNNFQGASGSITIDKNGDGIRNNYSMKVIRSGKAVSL